MLWIINYPTDFYPPVSLTPASSEFSFEKNSGSSEKTKGEFNKIGDGGVQQRERKLGKNIPGQKSSASNSEEEAIKWDTRDVEGETTRHASGCRSQGRRGLIGRRFPRSSKGSLGNEKCCKQGLLRGSFNRSPRRPRGPERFVRLDNVLPASSVFVSFHLSVPNSTDNFFHLPPLPLLLPSYSPFFLSGLTKLVRNHEIFIIIE